MSSRTRGVGAVVTRSTDRTESMRDEIVDGEGPGLDLSMDEPAPPIKSPKKRNRKAGGFPEPNYFKELDEILAESYTKQEAAHNIVEAFTTMMEARGINTGFEDERFERAASNMAVVSMMRQMAWLFGLGPELSDRIAEHTVDRLFSPGKATAPEVKKT